MIARIPRPWLTWSLLASLVVVFLLRGVASDLVLELALQPQAFKPWQLVTYACLHASWGHLAANGAGLVYFGCRVELFLGWRRYGAFLVVCAVGGGLSQLSAAWAGVSPAIATVGASGAVYGLLVAGWVLWPRDWVLRATVVMYAVLALVSVLNAGGGPTAVYAHLGGMATGVLWLRRPSGVRSTGVHDRPGSRRGT